MSFGKSIEKIVLLDPNSKDCPSSVLVYRKSRKRKSSRMLRKIGRSVERFAEAQTKMSQEYVARHKRSSSKKKDGWLVDFGDNIQQAVKRGRKTLKSSAKELNN